MSKLTLTVLDYVPYCVIMPGVPNDPKTGRFVKGGHWRDRKPFWNRDWLYHEYVMKKRACAEIAADFNVTPGAVGFWLHRHKIPGRRTAEVRALKHWGSNGEKNPMFGKRGVLNPRWQGGLSPLRQRIYARSDWRAFVRAVKKRDKACRLCGSHDSLVIHHIEPFSQAPLLVMDIGNVIRLCEPCHRKLQGKEKRWRKRLFALLKGGDAVYGDAP